MPDQRIERLERAKSHVGAVRALGSAVDEKLGEAYFERVRELSGQDPAAAKKLAGHWNLFLRAATPHALRTRALLERLDGHWQKSARSFLAARKASGDPKFAIAAVDSFARAGNPAQARALARELEAELKEVDRTELLGPLWLNAGNAALWSDDYAHARGFFQKAIKSGMQGHNAAAATLGLSTSELYGGDPRAARDHAERAAAEFEALGMQHHALVAKTNLAVARNLTGAPSESAADLLLLRTAAPDLTFEQARIEEALGDAYLASNLYVEAEAAYESAKVHSALLGSPANLANAELGVGMARSGYGRLLPALDSFARAAKAYKKCGNEVWEGVALTCLARANRQLGQTKKAMRLAEKAAILVAKNKGALRAETLLELAACKSESKKDATIEIKQAAKLIKSCGLTGLEWKLFAARASVATKSDALKWHRKMAQTLWRARLETSSVAARTAYLGDKSDALGRYLGHLLSTGAKSHLQEALDVVRHSRSAALYDEIRSAIEAKTGKAHLPQLEQLREEIKLATPGDLPGSTARRATLDSATIGRLQRKWTEATDSALGKATSVEGNADIVMVETVDSAYFIGPGSAIDIGQGWKDAIRWVMFDLVSPLFGAEGCAEQILQSLDDLSRQVWLPAAAPKGHVTVCPDGAGWSVPWQLMPWVRGEEHECVLSAGLWATLPAAKLPERPATALWYQNYPELPHIEREAAIFLQKFPDATVCTSLQELRRCMDSGRFDLLHVATHAVFNKHNPMFSALTFADGCLTAAEIAKSGLFAGNVTLSACDTGAVSVRNKFEPDGLVRAFLARGASSVLASSWAVDDRAAAMFMDAYYAEVVAGRSTLDGIASARKCVRSEYEHPYYWGPFVMFGGYQQ